MSQTAKDTACAKPSDTHGTSSRPPGPTPNERHKNRLRDDRSTHGGSMVNTTSVTLREVDAIGIYGRRHYRCRATGVINGNNYETSPGSAGTCRRRSASNRCPNAAPAPMPQATNARLNYCDGQGNTTGTPQRRERLVSPSGCNMTVGNAPSAQTTSALNTAIAHHTEYWCHQ